MVFFGWIVFPNVIRTLEFPVSLLHQSIDIDGFGGLMILNPFGSSWAIEISTSSWPAACFVAETDGETHGRHGACFGPKNGGISHEFHGFSHGITNKEQIVMASWGTWWQDPEDPCMPYMVTFTINIPQMLAYIPYMDPMGDMTSHGMWKLWDLQMIPRASHWDVILCCFARSRCWAPRKSAA